MANLLFEPNEIALMTISTTAAPPVTMPLLPVACASIDRLAAGLRLEVRLDSIGERGRVIRRAGHS